MKQHRCAPPQLFSSGNLRRRTICSRGRWRAALLVLLLLPLSAAGAAEQVPPTQAAGEKAPAARQLTCFDRAWHDAHDNPWYLDRTGRPIVPEVSHDWLVVQFLQPERIPPQTELTVDEPPAPAEAPTAGFDTRFADLLDYRLEMPGEKTAALYRVRPGLPSGAFEALLNRLREAPEISYVLPSWRIEDQLHAPLTLIEVTWKSVARVQEREALLQAAGARATGDSTGRATETVRIDPCRRAPWQAAVLLAEDLRVLRAVPRLQEIQPPVAVNLLVDINGAMAGTPIPFRLEIRFSDGILIESATLANLDLRPPGIYQNLYEVNFDQPLSGIELANSPITVTGRLLIYASGEFAIPAVPVYYTDNRTDARTIRTVRSRNTPIRIGAMVPETTGAYRLKVAPPSTPGPVALPGIADRQRTAMLLSGAGLLLLALAAIGWLQVRSRLALSRANGATLQLPRSREALAHWLDRDPAAMELADYAAFGEALRVFLAETAGLGRAVRGGSHASFLRNLENRLPPAALLQAEAILREIDHLLAGKEGSVESGRLLLDRAGELLSSLASVPADQGG